MRSDSLEWAAAVTSLLRRLYEVPTWKPIVAERLAEHIAAVTVSKTSVLCEKHDLLPVKKLQLTVW